MNKKELVKGLLKHPRSTVLNYCEQKRIQKKSHYDAFFPQDCPYEEDGDFSGLTTDIKTIALYLPQYHEFKENNEWWGKGFTEWVNVKKAYPIVEDHNQPRIPHDDIGYYDLSKWESIEKQIQMAKRHGIYAFGMYHYWFSGHKLMTKPMDLIYENKEIDFKYFAIWANENFTRTWDGLNNDILIAQEYTDEDPVLFINDLEKYLRDERYMRVDDKPVIGLYNPDAIPNVSHVLTTWRERANEIGIGEILIWTCNTGDLVKGKPYGELVDAEYEFPPRNKDFIHYEKMPNNGAAFDYIELVETAREFPVIPFNEKDSMFRGSMMEWDNFARRQSRYTSWKNYSPYRFYVWNRINVGYLRENFEEDKRFLFVNAWNEWGEGTYLEPDKKYGYAAINSLSRAIFDQPYSKDKGHVVNYIGGYRPAERQELALKKNLNFKIAIQIHCFYEDLIDEIKKYLLNIPVRFSVFITTDSEKKGEIAASSLQDIDNIESINLHVIENKGRDVLPFIKQMEPVIDDFDLLCHIHTKKSLYDQIGDNWRSYLFQNVLGSPDALIDILSLFSSNNKLGIIYPQTFAPIKCHLEWGSNRSIAERVLEIIGVEASLPDDVVFPAGNMFWARTDAIKDLINGDLLELWNKDDDASIDGTVMHAIERLWPYIAYAKGYESVVTRNVHDDFPLDISSYDVW